jgi:hypothetical protein
VLATTPKRLVWGFGRRWSERQEPFRPKVRLISQCEREVACRGAPVGPQLVRTRCPQDRAAQPDVHHRLHAWKDRARTRCRDRVRIARVSRGAGRPDGRAPLRISHSAKAVKAPLTGPADYPFLQCDLPLPPSADPEPVASLKQSMVTMV